MDFLGNYLESKHQNATAKEKDYSRQSQKDYSPAVVEELAPSSYTTLIAASGLFASTRRSSVAADSYRVLLSTRSSSALNSTETVTLADSLLVSQSDFDEDLT